MMKSMLRGLLAAVLSISILLMSFTVIANDEKIQIMIDGNVLVTDVAPTIIDGRTLVPLRAIFEALGASVEWDEATSTVTAKKEFTTIVLKINDKYPTVNGKQQELDVPATVIDDRTMVPVRFIANALGTDVAWDESTQTVIITTPTPAVFKDANLEKAVRDKVGIPVGELKAAAVRSIDTLEASNLQITSLEGIQSLTGLTQLNLSKNKITDVSPLKGLSKLMQLDISSNKIANINDLRNLINLTELKAQYNPLTNLDDIPYFTKSAKIYLLDGLYPIKKTDEASLDEYKAVIAKAVEVTQLVVTDKMSDLEKELALHDYLILHTTYDTSSYVNIVGSDNCHYAYGALVQGNAVCDGYAKAMEIMLNMVGVDCVTVIGVAYSYSGRPGGHAWNIVKIDGTYYQMDATFDDPDGNGADITHTYFNLSDKQMSVSRNWDRTKYPQCVTDNQNFEWNTQMFRKTIYYQDSIFKVASSNLYQINPETSIASKVCEDKVDEIQMSGDWIYYINASDQQKVYKIKADKTMREKVSDVPAAHISISGSDLYYIAVEDKGVYYLKNGDAKSLTKIDVGEFTTNIFILENYLYYRTFGWTTSGAFGRFKTGSSKCETIIVDIPAGFIQKDRTLSYNFSVYERINDGYIYYISTATGNKLCRAKMAGKESKVLSKDDVDSLYFEITNGYIYYKNASDSNKNYRMKVDGTERICIEK